ncbi:hypothetical protein EDD86DRAFT_179841, partial [Gorgonomyces haynaldii]
KKPARAFAGKSIQQKEFQAVHELCILLKGLSEAQGMEISHRRTEDYRELKHLTDESKKDDELTLLAVDAAMAIINLTVRKQTLRQRISQRLKEEKG